MALPPFQSPEFQQNHFHELQIQDNYRRDTGNGLGNLRKNLPMDLITGPIPEIQKNVRHNPEELSKFRPAEIFSSHRRLVGNDSQTNHSC